VIPRYSKTNTYLITEIRNHLDLTSHSSDNFQRCQEVFLAFWLRPGSRISGFASFRTPDPRVDCSQLKGEPNRTKLSRSARSQIRSRIDNVPRSIRPHSPCAPFRPPPSATNPPSSSSRPPSPRDSHLPPKSRPSILRNNLPPRHNPQPSP
jgi:hypothetical protein